MKLPPGLVGQSVGPLVQDIDARWLMAYAAALGESDPAYFDTLDGSGLRAHPLFPVCYEWPLALEFRAMLPEEIAIRSVHATHDLICHRPPRDGDRLATRATVIRVEPRRSGSYVLTRFHTRDARGELVSTTDYGSIYLGVDCEAEGAVLPLPSAERDGVRGDADWSTTIPIAATLAHLYTECARIWNPVHTDRAVARRAGLPDIILHGTATLALAVSRVLAREKAATASVKRIRGRFGAMVLMPSTVTVEGLPPAATAEGRRLPFRAVAQDGGPAIRDGVVWLGGTS